MAHELDEMWTLNVVTKDGSGVIDSTPDGHFYIRVGTGGLLDSQYSRHYRSGGTPIGNKLEGSVTAIPQVPPSYRVVLVEILESGYKRQYKGTLIRTSSNLILTGVRYKPVVMAATKKKGAARLNGQEEGTWVATKP